MNVPLSIFFRTAKTILAYGNSYMPHSVRETGFWRTKHSIYTVPYGRGAFAVQSACQQMAENLGRKDWRMEMANFTIISSSE